MKAKAIWFATKLAVQNSGCSHVHIFSYQKEIIPLSGFAQCEESLHSIDLKPFIKHKYTKLPMTSGQKFGTNLCWIGSVVACIDFSSFQTLPSLSFVSLSAWRISQAYIYS